MLNFGVGGYDVEYAAQRFLTRGVKYNPDIVLWFVKDDDFVERAEVEFEREPKYAETIEKELQGNIDKFKPYQRWKNEMRLVDGMFALIHGIVVREQIESGAYKDYFPLQEKAVYAVSESVKAPVVLATFQWTDPKFKARMKLWSNEKQNIATLDTVPELQSGIETFEPNDGHPNAKGYAVIASSLYSSLLVGGFLCK